MFTVKLRSIETPDEAFQLVLHDVVVSTFKFGGNRRFFGADTANFVGCRGGIRAIPLLVVCHIPVAYVSRLCEALNAELSTGYVCGVATYAAALRVGLALWAASSRVAESPAEVALNAGGG